MKKIIIRTDSSKLIGSGHVMRCLTLARELSKRNREIIFITRDIEGNLIEKIEKDFRVIKLKNMKIKKTGKLKGRKLYEKWLTCTQAEDAKECIELLKAEKKNEIETIIVDHYGLDQHWEERVINEIRKYNKKANLVVLDDLADRKHCADILIDQGYHGNKTKKRYKQLTNTKCRNLLGPKYALLGREYATANKFLVRRGKLKRIMVYFGGEDNIGLTYKAINQLLSAKITDIEYHVIINKNNKDKKRIQGLKMKNNNLILYSNIESLMSIMLRCDLLIGACGGTHLERSCLQLPSIVIPIAENQKEIAILAKKPFVDVITIKEFEKGYIKKIIKNYKKMGTEMKTDQKLTDGYGVCRVAICIAGIIGKPKLREAIDKDESILLEWANEKMVRAQSFNKKRIGVEEHKKWMKETLERENRLQYIMCDEDNYSFGQIRFDRNKGGKIATVDISIAYEARGRGIGKLLINLGLKKVREQWGENVVIQALVKANNTASNRVFEYTGFIKTNRRTKELNIWTKGVNED